MNSWEHLEQSGAQYLLKELVRIWKKPKDWSFIVQVADGSFEVVAIHRYGGRVVKVRKFFAARDVESAMHETGSAVQIVVKSIGIMYEESLHMLMKQMEQDAEAGQDA